MFPDKSSSYAISSKANAFVQNFKVEGESTVVVAVCAVLLTKPEPELVPVQPPFCCSAIPTYQVPDSTTDVTSVLVDGVGVVNGSSGSADLSAAAAAPSQSAASASAVVQMTTTASAATLLLHMSSSPPSPLSPSTHAATIKIKCSHTVGCEPSGCHEYPCTSSKKSEAVVGQHSRSRRMPLQWHMSSSISSSVVAVEVVARGKEGCGAGPLLPLPVSSLVRFFNLSSLRSSSPPFLLREVLKAASVIITSSTTIIVELMKTSTSANDACSSRRSSPSSLSFELQVSNATIADNVMDGNTSNSNSLSAQNRHPTNLMIMITIPHITSQAICSQLTTTDKFGAPYFLDDDEIDNNYNDDDDDDDTNYASNNNRFKICVKSVNDDDKCISVRGECERYAAAEAEDDIPVDDKDGGVEGAIFVRRMIGKLYDAAAAAASAVEQEKSFKYHCDHKVNVSNYYKINNDKAINSSYCVSDVYKAYARRWGIAPGLRLAGGGESSLNNAGGGGSGWGGGNSSNNNNANQAGGGSWNAASAQQQQPGGGSSQGGGAQNNNSGAATAGSNGGAANSGGQSGGSQAGGGAGGGQWGGNNQGRQQQAGGGVSATSQQQQQAANAQQNNSGNSGMKPVVSSGTNNQSQAGGQQQQQQQPNQQQQANVQNQQQQPNNNQSNQQQQQQQTSGQNNNGNGQQNGGSASGGGSWAAAAGKGLVTSSGGATSTPPPNGGSSGATSAAAAAAAQAATNKQLEQLNTMRESLFSLDGWGGQHVNQDSSWDIPPSPEPPTNKDGGQGGGANNGGAAPGAAAAPVWKPNINNGTELWEANLRNGGQVPVVVAAAQKTPWGHTPSSNLGGTWGEDDDLSDATNVWTGVPPVPPPSGVGPQAPPSGPPGGGPPQWGAAGVGAANAQPNTPIWAAPKKETDWGGGGSQWGGDHMGGGGRGGGGGSVVDPRDHMRVLEQSRVAADLMRGGRLNNVVGAGGDQMWPQQPQQPPPPPPSHQQPPPHHVGGHQPPPPHGHGQPPPNKMPPNPAVNQWPGPPPKDMGVVGMPGVGVGKPSSGWEEPSPPAQRRNIPNYDDGTSLWGAQQQRNTMPGQNKVSHWKEMPSPATMGGRGGGGGMQCPPGGGAMPVGRMPSKDGGGPLWGGSRNGAWDGGGHEVVGPWGGGGDDKQQQPPPQWNEPPWGMPQQPKPKQVMNNPQASWGGAGGGLDATDGLVDPSSWAHPPKQPLKPLTKEIIWASKQFRILSEMGFEKEKVETALRTFNMSLEDAIEYLNANRGLGGGMGGGDWRGGGSRHSNDMEPPPQQPPPHQPPPSAFDPPPPPHPNSTPQFAAAASQRGAFNPQQMPFAPPLQSSRNLPSNQPASNQQLRMLVQQIQLAVTAGYLNHQILNQPLAPQTLLLLNQLLQQIKVLHQLQHTIQQNPMAKNSNSLAISVQITKTKQQIANLQNQISAQQAIYVKQQQNPHQQQQQQQQHLSQNDFFSKQANAMQQQQQQQQHDPLSALQSNFADLAMKDAQQSQQQQQSRLSQWKLPSLPTTAGVGDKDDGGTDFSRAPGSTAKSQAGGNSSPNALNPLLSQPDTTWSVGRSSDTGWPDSGSNHDGGGGDKDWPSAATSQAATVAAAAFTDLVPEFEPGKPWKGNQMKSIEDDPTITPGSLQQAAVSSLTPNHAVNKVGGGNSVSAADDMFGGATSGRGNGKVSPPPLTSAMDMPPIPSLSLSSSTWSFQPTSSAQSSFNSPLSKMSMSSSMGGMKSSASSSAWGGGDPTGHNELWSSGGGQMKAPRQGPPPGLSKAPPPASASNGWGSLSGRWGAQPSHATSSWGGAGGAVSLWLLLKNLTPQIDGSTLKTLCLQHGPLQNFHMYLSHGIAFAKYNTREEATKAQGALNNCVLGNTTIFADIQPEAEIVALLHQLGGSTSSGGGGGASPWSAASGMRQQQVIKQQVPPPSLDTWGSTSQLWGGAHSAGGGNSSTSSLWGAALDSASATPVDPHRTTPSSSLNSFLPPDLLGGESMSLF